MTKSTGLSANTISRLKQHWIEEHRNWCQRDLSHSRYVYWWADGISGWMTAYACW